MKCKICGNTHFFAHQILRADIICDGAGEFEDNLGENDEIAVYDSEAPYGPFTCTICGAEYDELRNNENPNNREEITLEGLKVSAAYVALEKMGMSKIPRIVNFVKNSLGEFVDAAHAGRTFEYAAIMREDGEKMGIYLSNDLYKKMNDKCHNDAFWGRLEGTEGTVTFAKCAGSLVGIPKEDLQEIHSLEFLKTVIAAECDRQLGLPGYRDYLEENLGAAIETVIAKGNIHDVDNIVLLEGLLGFRVSYDLYHYLNSSPEYEDKSFQETCGEDIPVLMRLVIQYIREKKH